MGIRHAIALIAIFSGFNSTAITAQKPVSPDGAAFSATGALPPDFRGRISYSGTHEGQLNRAGPPLRSLRTRDILRSATGGSTREYAGAYNLELTFDGNALTGRYSGTGGMNSGTVSGTRSGTHCRLVDDRYGTVTEAECTRNRFSGTARVQRGRDTSTMRFEAAATQFVDARVAQEQRRLAAAEAAQRERAAAAAYDALPNAGAALTRRLDGFVQTDSRGWAFNRYNTGSVANVKIVEGSIRSGNFVMQGYYNYNGGSRGWVMAKMTGGRLECIQFWDSVIGCRGLRTAAQGQAMRDAAMGAIAGGLSNGSSGQSREICRSGYGTGTPGTEQPC